MIRYNLLKWLFGWDYIQWRNSADSGVARIQKDHNGTVFYFRYKITRVVDRVTDPNDVIWLTCPPTKYFDKVG